MSQDRGTTTQADSNRQEGGIISTQKNDAEISVNRKKSPVDNTNFAKNETNSHISDRSTPEELPDSD